MSVICLVQRRKNLFRRETVQTCPEHPQLPGDACQGADRHVDTLAGRQQRVRQHRQGGKGRQGRRLLPSEGGPEN